MIQCKKEHFIVLLSSAFLITGDFNGLSKHPHFGAHLSSRLLLSSLHWSASLSPEKPNPHLKRYQYPARASLARKLLVTKQAHTFLNTLPPKQFRQVFRKALALLEDPRPHDAEQLKGYPFSRNDVGEYRIIYESRETPSG